MPVPPAQAAPSFRPIALLSAAAFASAATLRVSDAILPQLAAEFSVSVGSAAGVATAFAVSYGLCQLFYGFLGDRFGKYTVVTLATFLSALAAAAAAASPSLTVLEILRFLNGSTAAAIVPLSLAHIGDVVPYEDRQTALARFISGQILGVISGQFLGGIFGEYVGWRGIFLALGAAYLAIAVLLSLELGSPRLVQRRIAGGGGARGILTDLLTILAIGQVRIVIGVVFAEGFVFFGAFAYLGAYLRDAFAMRYVTMGAFLACFGLGGLVYALSAPRIVPALGQRGMVLAGGGTLAAAFLVLAAGPPWWSLAPVIAMVGFSFYIMHNTLQTNATQMAPHARGLALSIFASCLFIGQAAGAAALGWGVDHLGYGPVFGAAGLLLLALALAFRAALRR